MSECFVSGVSAKIALYKYSSFPLEANSHKCTARAYNGPAQWPQQEFSFGGYSPRAVRDGRPPLECTGEGKSGYKGPQKLKQFADVVDRFWLQKIWKFHTIYLLILDQYVSRWGAKRPIWGLSHHLSCLPNSVRISQDLSPRGHVEEFYERTYIANFICFPAVQKF